MEPWQKTMHPLLYQKTRRKRIKVQQDMANDKWIDQVYPQASQGEVSKFVRLWEAIMDIRLWGYGRPSWTLGWTMQLKTKLVLAMDDGWGILPPSQNYSVVLDKEIWQKSETKHRWHINLFLNSGGPRDFLEPGRT
jgi:hypothetical protein